MYYPKPCNLMTDYVADQHTDEGLYTYTVIRQMEPLIDWDYFICEAESAEHAEEQALNDDHSMPVLWVNRGLNFSQEDVFDVTIEARIRKTYRVHASSIDEAVELAHQEFSVMNDSEHEDYEQETLTVREVVWD